MATRRDGERSEKRIMKMIVDKPSITGQELAERLGHAKSNISYHLKSMEQRNLIQRSTCVCCGARTWLVVAAAVNNGVS